MLILLAILFIGGLIYFKFEPKLDILVLNNQRTIVIWYSKKKFIRNHIKIYTYYIT